MLFKENVKAMEIANEIVLKKGNLLIDCGSETINCFEM